MRCQFKRLFKGVMKSWKTTRGHQNFKKINCNNRVNEKYMKKSLKALKIIVTMLLDQLNEWRARS